ncbi:MAG: GTP 3',8-cyclase MoaA [Candidatus Omnitrophota bacterium]
MVNARKVNYLRLSITDRCNIRCLYCMPKGKDFFLPHHEILSFEEIADAVDILTQNGIEYARITGGEPLLRRDVEVLIKMLRKKGSLKEINMTTNGILLSEKLNLLIKSGLDRLNVSLNTLKRKRYQQIAGVDKFDKVFASVTEAMKAFKFPVKINIVVLKGVNDDEIEEFAAFSLNNNVCVRFIEYFPVNGGVPSFQFISNFLIKNRIEKIFGNLIFCGPNGSGPSENYKIKDARGEIGFINTRTGFFCEDCNRLRLTAGGRLYPCLFSSFSMDIKDMLRRGAGKDEIKRGLDEVLSKKKVFSKSRIKKYDVAMSRMGG